MTKSLITGSEGFIGRHLVSLFNDPLLCDVIPMPNVCLPDEIDLDNNEIEAVYHLGAISSTTETDTVSIVKNNILFSCKLLEKCIEKNIPFIYASSASVYGLGHLGFLENVEMTPLNYYAISKSAFDSIAMKKIVDNPNAKIIGLRYFNVYGPGEDHKGDMSSPVHKFFTQSLETGLIKVFEGSKKFVRDFIHVIDVANITKNSRCFPAGLYNVGTGKSRSFFDVAKIISNYTEAKIVEIPFPKHLLGKYQTLTCSENSKINIYYPAERLSLEDGIKKFIEQNSLY
jgi:ADP-L-glycero-D-manno-heptose 6-epimerase